MLQAGIDSMKVQNDSIEVAYFNFYLEVLALLLAIFLGTGNGLVDTTGEVNMIVFIAMIFRNLTSAMLRVESGDSFAGILACL